MLSALLYTLASTVIQVDAISSVVSLSQGSYQGVPLANGITQWLGMRYAAAPLNQLRFAEPQEPPMLNGIVPANKAMPGCMGTGPGFDGSVAEDCLFIDVYAPTGANQNSKLPVFFFIQGGGFNGDNGHYNGSGLIIAANMNLVTISITYRGGALGFLASNEVAKGGSFNNGLKDQRKALEWVQRNIAQFGGDPGSVTMGGQSAGAGSVMQHLVAYGGRDMGLFSAAIMQSQSLPPTRTIADSQYQYDHLVQRAGCSGQPDTLACLRNMTIVDFQKANLNEPYPDGAGGNPVFSYNPVIDNDMITDYPVNSFNEGKFVHVPTLLGSNSNEGTIFTPQTLQTEQQSRDFLKNSYPTLTTDQLDKISSLFTFADEAASGYPYWHKASAAYGDIRYICPGTLLSDALVLHGNTQVWQYHFDVIDAGLVAKGLNVMHGAEMGAVFGPGYIAAPKSYTGVNAAIVPLVQNYWASFMQRHDPNILVRTNTAKPPQWDAWSPQSWNRIHLVADKPAMEMVDGDLKAKCTYIDSIAVSLTQ